VKDFNKMSTSQLDKLLLDYVLEGRDSFYSDKELAEMKTVANAILKELFPKEDPEEIERSNEEFLGMLNEEVARKKLEQEAKARRVVIDSGNPLKLSTSLSHTGNPFPMIIKKESIEWKSEFGTKFEDGWVIKSVSKSAIPVMTLEQVRAFANYILEVTK